MKFECSKLLRSSQADHDYIFLLCILSRNLSEPFWSRAQQQLQFRNSDFPLANVLVRLLILDDEMESQMMESQMRSWLKGFIVHHQVSFAHSLCIHRPCQWHELLIRTFLDDKVFTPCKATPVQTVQKIRDSVPEWILPHFGANVCVYTVITNGFSSFHCSCTILKSRGQRYPCHFLCQRSWVTCGKDIDQGRLIYVPAIVSTVDFLFLFMSCALFLRSRIWVRWNSTARQLRKSGEDYDIIHTFYLPLPHSVSWVFDLTWSHRRLVSTNQKVMSGHFPVFRVEYESPKPYALRVHFKRHMTKSRFYTVKSNRSSHKAKKP